MQVKPYFGYYLIQVQIITLLRNMVLMHAWKALVKNLLTLFPCVAWHTYKTKRMAQHRAQYAQLSVGQGDSTLSAHNNSPCLQNVLANEILTLLCLYLRLWSVGSGERPKMQGSSVQRCKRQVRLLSLTEVDNINLTILAALVMIIIVSPRLLHSLGSLWQEKKMFHVVWLTVVYPRTKWSYFIHIGHYMK